jgi:rSAM/selenodomain-associated transferase 2/rSAM/selenodomain-associated transferase 1
VARDRIILFTRYPEPGATKTRLIPALGREGAADIHRALTEHALRKANAFTDADTEVHWTGGDEPAMRAWLPASVLRRQCEGDLGARMLNALVTAFAEGAARAVVVGSDCPDLGPETYDAAFDALDSHDLVLGPATDGGYYLIGARASAADPLPSLFTGMPWGTATVFRETVHRAEKAGLSRARTAMLADVDLPEDLRLWERHSPECARPRLSVIIPALNEAERISTTIFGLIHEPGIEIIVADGGSTDATREVVCPFGIRILMTPRGRANQMNFAAAHASSDTLLFLHADTRLPPDYLDRIHRILDQPGVAAGAFKFRTDFDSTSMRVVTTFANLRARLFELPYGDQGLFLRTETFRRAGGFASMHIMEDYEFVRRVRRWGRIAIDDAPAITSGDRWRTLGVWRTTLRNARIVALYALGVAPERLREIYRRP